MDHRDHGLPITRPRIDRAGLRWDYRGIGLEQEAGEERAGSERQGGQEGEPEEESLEEVPARHGRRTGESP
ncbi:hypothetical protein [Candidatus Nitrospira bockiana]